MKALQAIDIIRAWRRLGGHGLTAPFMAFILAKQRGERPCLRHFNEVIEMAKLHGCTYYCGFVYGYVIKPRNQGLAFLWRRAAFNGVVKEWKKHFNGVVKKWKKHFLDKKYFLRYGHWLKKPSRYEEEFIDSLVR